MKNTKDNKKTPWKTTDMRFVAFLDILGFKELVMREPHRNIYKKLKRIADAKKVLKKAEDNPETCNMVGNGGIYTVTFSDSIGIFSENDNIKYFKPFIFTLRLLFIEAILSGLPLKGGIAYGKISLEKNEQTYFGQPIIDAHLMEEEVNYMGVIVHSMEKYIENQRDKLDSKFIDKWFFECETPLKCGKIKHTNLNWFGSKFSENIPNNKNLVENIIKVFRLSSSGYHRKYVDNTLEMLDKLDEKHLYLYK